MVQAVRGAIQVEKDEPSFIESGVQRMIEEVIKKNSLEYEDLISIQFSITPDLQSKNPAAALRIEGFSTIPLFCSAEPQCDGMLPRMIRTIVMFNTTTKIDVTPVYLDGAEKLRPDLFE
ncbi:MAG: chorismate mutase [Spirochaetales bacterium]|nr:chorismate mutase [Spirochaetales bacterium]